MPTYVLTPSGPCLVPGAGPWLIGPRELPALDMEPRRSGLFQATGPTALLRGVPVTAATRVLLTDGTLMPAVELRAGALVQSWDPETGQPVAYELPSALLFEGEDEAWAPAVAALLGGSPEGPWIVVEG